MPQLVSNALTDKQCQSARDVTLHDGQGLQLVCGERSKSWLMRYQFRGRAKRAKIGLGPYPVVTLQRAREEKLKILRLCHDRIDPKVARERERGHKTFSETLTPS